MSKPKRMTPERARAIAKRLKVIEEQIQFHSRALKRRSEELDALTQEINDDIRLMEAEMPLPVDNPFGRKLPPGYEFCKATVATGRRCRKPVQKGWDFCGSHRSQRTNPEQYKARV